MQFFPDPEATFERSRTQLVVDLPTLAIRDQRSTQDRSQSSTPRQDALDLFVVQVSTLVNTTVLPALLSNQVWTGDLPMINNDQTEFVPTMWVPHIDLTGSGDAPTLATIVIGDARDASSSSTDPLTGLPTRVLLVDRLDQAIRRSRRTAELIALLFIDLDGLKSINDCHGHDLGDAALVHTAVGIRSCLREGDTVARLGGDEFVVVCENLGTELQAERVAERIISILGQNPVQPLSASIGLAFDRGGSLTGDELVTRADAAMYQAKAAGGGRTEVFDREMQGRLAADRDRRVVLSAAIERDAVDFVTQPIYALTSGRVIGVELFVRMNGLARDTALEADEVLRLIREHTQAIDAAMLRHAVDLARLWRDQLGTAAPRVHLNVSAQSLAGDRYARLARALFDQNRLSPSALAFEVSSTEVSPGDDRELVTMSALRRMGAAVVVDGYGIGTASLPLIARIAPSMVKVTSLNADRSGHLDAEVVVGLIRAASALGLSTCVKGIETHEMLEQVVLAGSFAGQGNTLAPVGPAQSTRALFDDPLDLGF